MSDIYKDFRELQQQIYRVQAALLPLYKTKYEMYQQLYPVLKEYHNFKAEWFHVIHAILTMEPVLNETPEQYEDRLLDKVREYNINSVNELVDILLTIVDCFGQVVEIANYDDLANGGLVVPLLVLVFYMQAFFHKSRNSDDINHG
ncbi:hypothetical protein [uncultured Anaerovibrio sp.]|uniref:hypothetical protein n=1 Tax=uncultured Anaerovibrio sp. TaxID=361586 RepID=UPI00263A1CEE|nr:hypothetical protein [uncultured Anaerovibrio sp.]